LALKKVSRFFWAAVALAGLVLILSFSYQSVRAVKGSFSILLESLVLSAISTYLLFFLALLVIRYLVLIVYSFLEHLETLHTKRDLSPERYRDESSMPMISLVVPAFNEAL